MTEWLNSGGQWGAREIGPLPEDDLDFEQKREGLLQEYEAFMIGLEADRWLEIEECLDSIVMDVQNRCYPEQSDTGVRGLMLLVRRHLWKVEQLLLEDHA